MNRILAHMCRDTLLEADPDGHRIEADRTREGAAELPIDTVPSSSTTPPPERLRARPLLPALRPKTMARVDPTRPMGGSQNTTATCS